MIIHFSQDFPNVRKIIDLYIKLNKSQIQEHEVNYLKTHIIKYSKLLLILKVVRGKEHVHTEEQI